jgi:thiosulfate/3-mercaptopyruvate sulfurtransferase
VSRRPRLLDVPHAESRGPASRDNPAANALVTPQWLAERLGEAGVAVVDMRWRDDGSSEALFEAGHVPGARPLDWSRDIVDRRHPVAFMLAPPEEFAATIEAVGIGDETIVVAYSDRGGSGPFRLWWAFRAYGHDTVRILDGGMEAWRAGGRPIESGRAAPVAPAAWRPRASLDPRPAATADDVLSSWDDGVVLLDSRSADQFRGEFVWFETGPVPAGADGIARTARGDVRAGRVPWATNVPWSSLYRPDGRLRPSGELAALFAEAGVEPASRAVTYCGVGISACALLFALRLAGLEDVSLYDGSWDEWGRLEGAPVARG